MSFSGRMPVGGAWRVLIGHGFSGWQPEGDAWEAVLGRRLSGRQPVAGPQGPLTLRLPGEHQGPFRPRLSP